MGKEINYEIVSEALKDYHAAQKKQLTAQKIKDAVASYFDVDVDEMVGKNAMLLLLRPDMLPCIFAVS